MRAVQKAKQHRCNPLHAIRLVKRLTKRKNRRQAKRLLDLSKEHKIDERKISYYPAMDISVAGFFRFLRNYLDSS